MTENEPESHGEPAPVLPPPPGISAQTRWAVLLVIALSVCGLDQLSKHWAQNTLQELPRRTVVLVQDYAAFSYVRNHGAAWGFLSDVDDAIRRPFFIIVTSLAMIFILFIYLRLEPWQLLLMVALALVLGGALGNFIDRVRYNYVVDFILLHWQRRYRWPIFNVADIAISVGVGVLLLEMFLGPWMERRRLRAAAAAAAAEVAAAGPMDEDS